MSETVTVPAGYKEVHAPELFKFEKIGQTLEGILVKAQTIVINGDKVLELYFSTGRRVVRYRPGWDIREKLNKSMIGKSLFIHYFGDDHTRGKDGNALKCFNVYVKDPDDPSDPGITDDDIPF